MTLFKRLMIGSIVLVGFAVVISTTLAILGQTRVLNDELTSKSHLMAEQIALSIQEAFRSMSWFAAENAIQHIAGAEEVIFCKAVMPDGTVYLADDKEYYGESIEPSILSAESSLIKDYSDPRTGRQGMLAIEQVEIGQETWWILLAVSAESVNEATRSVLLNSLLAAAAIMIPTTIGALVLSRGISGPIVQLADAAQAFAAGRLDHPIDTKASGEVGVLVRAFNTMTGQLRDLLGSLEQRVFERTVALERRALQLQAAAAVAHTATSVLDPDELMHQVVTHIREQFDLYHVGLFLLDPTGRWAEYRAGSGEAGRLMVEQGFRLEVGGTSIVGWCIARAQPHVTPDVSQEPLYREHPLLPDTRSEAVLLLVARGRIIGVLDAESAEKNAFSKEDVAVLQMVANQIAVAIDNSRLFTEAQQSLAEAQVVHRHYLREAWAGFAPSRPSAAGYRYATGELESDPDAWLPAMTNAQLQNRLVVAPDQDRAVTLSLPIRLRGETIGVLGFKREGQDRWTEDDIAIAQAVADQVALSLENIRLFDDAQRRARREALARELTDKMRRTTDIDTILETAVQGLGKALDSARAFARLGVPSEE